MVNGNPVNVTQIFTAPAPCCPSFIGVTIPWYESFAEKILPEEFRDWWSVTSHRWTTARRSLSPSLQCRAHLSPQLHSGEGLLQQWNSRLEHFVLHHHVIGVAGHIKNLGLRTLAQNLLRQLAPAHP